MVDVNGILNQFQALAQGHPYLALGIILIIIGALARGKSSIVFYTLGALALLKEFGLFDTFVSFLKQVPGMIKDLASVFGGG